MESYINIFIIMQLMSILKHLTFFVNFKVNDYVDNDEYLFYVYRISF